jgi:hypothetical protein
MIQRTFNVTGLYLTNPTFFSRITDAPPKVLYCTHWVGSGACQSVLVYHLSLFLLALQTDNDMYWMPHIDRDTYGSFVYTSLLYLNTMGVDYQVCVILLVAHMYSFLQPVYKAVSVGRAVGLCF